MLMIKADVTQYKLTRWLCSILIFKFVKANVIKVRSNKQKQKSTNVSFMALTTWGERKLMLKKK